MKKIFFLLFLSFFTFLVKARQIPESSNRLVTDYTQTLTSEQIGRLEQKLIAFDDSTSNQIAVVLVKTVSDYDINEYALELGRKWGVGGKEKNNGIVLLIALGDRKLSIQTGYGLEGALPDIYTKRIIENDIKPYFKSGNYYEGIDAGVDAIIALTKGEYKNNKAAAQESSNKGAGGIGAGLIILIVIIIFIIGKRGGGGRGGEIISGRGVGEALLWGMLLGGGGRHRDRGGFGGGGFGGGSSGGGFGGFGGGSFGGGGSSGSW
ncbi:TPM domain protein [compost metagenome]